MINNLSMSTGVGLLRGTATFNSQPEMQSAIDRKMDTIRNDAKPTRELTARERAIKEFLSDGYEESMRELLKQPTNEYNKKYKQLAVDYFANKADAPPLTTRTSKAASLNLLIDTGPIAFRDRGEAMQDSYSIVDQLFKDVKTLNTNRQGIIYQQNALEGKEVPDSFRHIRGYGPDGRLIIDYTRPIGDEMTEENIAYAHKAIANMNEIIGKTLTSIDQIGKALGDTFEIAGTLTKTNKDGTLGLGQFEIRHQDYGLLMASDGQGNVTMYDQNGTGKDPLSYVQGDAKLRDYYMSTTVDLRF